MSSIVFMSTLVIIDILYVDYILCLFNIGNSKIIIFNRYIIINVHFYGPFLP